MGSLGLGRWMLWAHAEPACVKSEDLTQRRKGAEKEQSWEKGFKDSDAVVHKTFKIVEENNWSRL